MFKKAVVACSILLFVVLVAACASGSPATPTTAPPTPTTAAAVITWPTPLPVPTATLAADRAMVANTGSQGVFIRKTPGGEAIRGWNDGSVMQVVGADQQSGGRAWRNVKDPSGNVGWIAAEFLVPAPAAVGTATVPAATPTVSR